MPRGPKGEKRPADVTGNAVKVMRIATGEETETLADDGKDKAAQALGGSKTLWEIGDIVKLVETAEAKPVKRGPYRKHEGKDA
ncbi:MAG: hypothetical protein ACLQE9_13505 [Roseiarcus sp.]